MPNVYVSYQTLASLPLASTQVVKSSCNPKWDYQKLERISHTSLKSQVKFYLAYNKTTSLFAPHRNLAYSKKMISWSRTSSIDIYLGTAIRKANLRELFSYATSQTHFLFNGFFHDQCDGVAMSSPVAPILANLVKGYREEQWIITKILSCYITADTLMTLSIYFTMSRTQWSFEVISTLDILTLALLLKLNSGKLPFLDVLVDNSRASCITSIYHKSTYTGLLTNCLNFTCFKYKVSLIYTLVDRIITINNTTTGPLGKRSSATIAITLQRNSFRSHLIGKISKGCKNKFSFRPTQNNTSTTGENTTGIRYFKLPLVGDFSTITRKKTESTGWTFFLLSKSRFFQFQRSYSRCIKIPGCVSIHLCRM